MDVRCRPASWSAHLKMSGSCTKQQQLRQLISKPLPEQMLHQQQSWPFNPVFHGWEQWRNPRKSKGSKWENCRCVKLNFKTSVNPQVTALLLHPANTAQVLLKEKKQSDCEVGRVWLSSNEVFINIVTSQRAHFSRRAFYHTLCWNVGQAQRTFYRPQRSLRNSRLGSLWEGTCEANITRSGTFKIKAADGLFTAWSI